LVAISLDTLYWSNWPSHAGHRYRLTDALVTIKRYFAITKEYEARTVANEKERFVMNRINDPLLGKVQQAATMVAKAYIHHWRCATGFDNNISHNEPLMSQFGDPFGYW
jgi:hypothetical protein